jgi:chromosome segregation ATPase
VEDRISKLKNKIGSKEKTEEFLDKRLKSCERNMQEISNSIKRPNLRIMGLEESQRDT